jgi:chemotaxis protein CheX
MLSLDLADQEPSLDKRPAPAGDGIVSFVGLAGDWVGTGSIGCSAQVACKISSQFLMGEYQAVDDEVLDAVAEVTNMIIGNVKTKLEERVGPMGLSIPTVIYGRNFTSRTVGTNDWTIVPFDLGGEMISIQVSLVQKEEIKHRPNFTMPSAVSV